MDKKFDLEFIKRLFTTRKLIALTMTAVANYLWATGQIDLKDVFLIVIGFYFGNKTALDIPGKDS